MISFIMINLNSSLIGFYIRLWHLSLCSMYYAFKVNIFIYYYGVCLFARLKPLDPFWIYPWVYPVSEGIGCRVNLECIQYTKATVGITRKELYQLLVSASCSNVVPSFSVLSVNSVFHPLHISCHAEHIL